MDQKSAAIETVTGSARSDRSVTVLIVEDSAVQAELLRWALEGAGYKVIAASDGAEGLAMAKANHPAAVVSDINMPVMDGYELCHAIRVDAALKDTLVILLTMLSDPLDVIRGLNAGADGYVTKPYNVPSLVSRVQSLLSYPPVPPPPLERRRVEIRLAGETHLVDAHGPRMLNLLVSTYENAMLQNRELTATQQALEELNQHLEQRVLEQTAALQDSERRFRTLIEDGSDLVIVIDARGAIAYVSPSIKRLGGYEVEELLGPDFLEFTHPEDRADTAADIAEVVRNPAKRHVTELRFRHKNNTWITLESIERNALADPAINGIVMNLRDITERKRAQAAITASEARYRRLFEAARDGILILDVQSGQIVDVNPFMIELLGYTREQFQDKKLWEIGPFKDTVAAKTAFAELQQKKHMHYENLPLRTADGRDIKVEFVSHVYRVNSGEVAQCNIRDITERKRAEEQLRRVGWALRALSQGNSALVHAGDEQELFRSCCEAIAGAGGYPLAWIGVAKQDSERSVEIAASAGEAIGFMTGLKMSWGDGALGRGPCGTAIPTGATQLDNDFATNPAHAPWLEQARASGLTSAVSLPIRTDGAIAGVLKVYSREPTAFGEDEVKLFEQLAGDIGYGLATRRTRIAYEESLLARQRDAERLRATFESTIVALAATVEQRDPYTAGHQRRVGSLAVAIGRALGLDEQHLEGLRITGAIHDIGKLSVPADILSRPGKLSEYEFAIIRGHAQAGYEIVKGVDFPWPVAQTILQHHERLDGSGYPQGLKGEQIILEARILAAADVLEAMSSHRPYRSGLGIDAALKQLRREEGTRFDPTVVEACERLFQDKGFRLPD